MLRLFLVLSSARSGKSLPKQLLLNILSFSFSLFLFSITFFFSLCSLSLTLAFTVAHSLFVSYLSSSFLILPHSPFFSFFYIYCNTFLLFNHLLTSSSLKNFFTSNFQFAGFFFCFFLTFKLTLSFFFLCKTKFIIFLMHFCHILLLYGYYIKARKEKKIIRKNKALLSIISIKAKAT